MTAMFRNIGRSVLNEFPLFTACLLLLSVPAGYGFFGDNRHFAPVLFATAAVTSVPFALLPCMLMRPRLRWMAWTLVYLYLLLFIVDTFLYVSFCTRMHTFIILLMLQTNPQEAGSFIKTFVLSRETLGGFDLDFVSKQFPHLFHSPQSLNILHLYGQHFNAKDYYPSGTKEWDRFKKTDIKRSDLNDKQRQMVADYDNCTRYNDAVVAKIIDQFRKDDAILIYFSDHGEQVYDDNRHMYARNIININPSVAKAIYEIPFFIWVSDKYKAAHPDIVQRIAAAVDLPFSNDETCYLLFDLAGINFKGNKPECSVINTRFKPHQRILRNNDDTYNYDLHRKDIERVRLLTPRKK